MNPTEGGTRVASESSDLKMRFKSQLLTGCILQSLKYHHKNNSLINKNINVCLLLSFPDGNDVYGVRKIDLTQMPQSGSLNIGRQFLIPMARVANFLLYKIDHGYRLFG